MFIFKLGERVRVVNAKSSFYGETGMIVAINHKWGRMPVEVRMTNKDGDRDRSVRFADWEIETLDS